MYVCLNINGCGWSYVCLNTDGWVGGEMYVWI